MPVDQIPLHERIAALNLPASHYALAGDAGLAAYGLLEAGRIDLIVSPAVFRGLPERGWTALPGTDGKVLTYGDVTARTRTHNLSHLSTIDFISDVDQVAGLPVLKLPVLRQSLAASGSTEAVLWRLGLIDQMLGQSTFARHRVSPPFAQVRRPRSHTIWAHLRGVITEPTQTFLADRGVSRWGAAYALACLVVFSSMLVDGGNGGASLVGLVVGTPLAAGIMLLLRRGVTGVARRVCGGDPEIGSPTASQAAIVASLTTIPVVAIELIPVPMVWSSLLALVAFAFALFIELWLVGILYSAAFGCPVGRGVLGELAGWFAIFLAFFVVGFGVAALAGG